MTASTLKSTKTRKVDKLLYISTNLNISYEISLLIIISSSIVSLPLSSAALSLVSSFSLTSPSFSYHQGPRTTYLISRSSPGTNRATSVHKTLSSVTFFQSVRSFRYTRIGISSPLLSGSSLSSVQWVVAWPFRRSICSLSSSPYQNNNRCSNNIIIGFLFTTCRWGLIDEPFRRSIRSLSFSRYQTMWKQSLQMFENSTELFRVSLKNKAKKVSSKTTNSPPSFTNIVSQV